MKGLTHEQSRKARERICQQCGQKFMAVRVGHTRSYCTRLCSALAGAAMRQPHRIIARSTAGLSHRQRAKLLRKWKRQGRRCTYCPATATTIDHVIPQARGGHHYEGNLTPACLPCNSTKNDLLLVEWMHGYTASNTTTTPVMRQYEPRKVKATRQLHPCGICTAPTETRYCSDSCRVERNRRLQRDRYRSRQGLPIDPQQPTSKWELAA